MLALWPVEWELSDYSVKGKPIDDIESIEISEFRSPKYMKMLKSMWAHNHYEELRKEQTETIKSNE